ncbi:NADP-dependent oxidoreductase [Bradyrhizobium neotropicale]|uniref:NADP-dependent oxidoreductase n=1 Tax=Bradyrhizobium neotropicale TaxID=1497615 RepID=UPI001AD7E51A|nr:NADP-dependent oxidoreductase [Bradyrhizobium neotropicale]MBO4226868.1 zinc-binding dehydrogenase [Bradyrhizobium neotropicale]
MLAWRVHEFGPPEAMILEKVPRPVPGPGEVLIEVHAAGVGPWDGWIRAGKSALPQPLPLTLGSDLSGTAAALGSGVSDIALGEQVFGVTNSQFVGAYAEYAVASAGMLAKKPSSLTYAEAASVPVVAVTAWQALFDHARLQAGQTVVIHGAGGNVGAYAVQLARRARLRSIATAGTKDIEYVRSLGADKVLDYHAQRFEDAVKDADAVFDLVGGETQERSFQVLRPGGKLISAVSQPDQARAKHHGVSAAFFLVEVTTERLRGIADLIDRGELKTHVGMVLPFADARDAHMMLEGQLRPPKGKIILNVEAAGDVPASA